MRSQSAIKFAAVILVIAALAYVAIYGIDFGFNVFGNSEEYLRQPMPYGSD